MVSVSVSEGDEVRAGQPLVVMEAMKMEHVITAERSGVLRRLAVAAGDTVWEGAPLLFIEERNVEGATVVQDCVVTLAPVTTRIDERVQRRYMTDPPEPDTGEAEMPEDDVEELPQALDLGEVMLEALALALPAYPRAAGVELGETVVTRPGAEALTEERAKPFAGLRDVLKPKD